MAVPEQVRLQLSRWCAGRIPAAERERRQIGYTIHDDEVTITDRRSPAHSQLGGGWTSTPLARLHRSEDGSWTLYRPSGEGAWRHAADGDDPIALLNDAADSQAPA